MSVDALKSTLLDLLQVRVSREGWAWLEKTLADLNPGGNLNVLLGNYAGMGRRLGKTALGLTPEEESRVTALNAALCLNHWGCDEVGRCVMLLDLAGKSAPEAFIAQARACYEKGDSREQESWLRGLALLPDGGEYLDSAVDACRTNIIPIFESIACDNPYPAQHFSDLNFNQMILKLLFNNIALERVVNLEDRLNPNLSRMCDDYVSEREAAGRAVPHDIWLALAPLIGPEGLARVLNYLGHEEHRHRYFAAKGLARVKGEAVKKALLNQREVEGQETVKTVLDIALASM